MGIVLSELGEGYRVSQQLLQGFRHDGRLRGPWENRIWRFNKTALSLNEFHKMRFLFLIPLLSLARSQSDVFDPLNECL